MNSSDAIRAAGNDPEVLEKMYGDALREGTAAAFLAGIETAHADEPQNMLYAAWHYRLRSQPTAEVKPGGGANWRLAIPLGVVTGLVFWALSDENLLYLDQMPLLFLLWAPIATLLALVFLSVSSGKEYRRSVLAGGLIVFCSAGVFLLAPGTGSLRRQYLELMAIHLPLLCWAGLGLSQLIGKSSDQDRFSFLMKSVEVGITAGLYLIAGVAFGGITLGMFQALSIELPETILRLIAAGGFGILPVLAVASSYDPRLPPSAQDFSQGLSRFIATMMRLLLPLTLIVLVIYLAVIPFNFMEPFRNRDVLIVYNIMLFAILGLLIGVTPVHEEELSPRLLTYLRLGILAVAGLTEIVSLYAFSATIFRTLEGGITINRLAILGWNGLNIAILALVITRLARSTSTGWVAGIKSTFSMGMIGYLVWDLFLILIVPLLFR